MQKVVYCIFLVFLLIRPALSQFDDRFDYIDDKEISNYVKPLVTTLGVAFNSATTHSADVADLWGVSFGVYGMYILIPESQRTFTPNLPSGYESTQSTATIYGHKGSAYAGPGGFRIYPPGFNQTAIPAGVPQLGVSFMNTEVLIRFFPETKISDDNKKINLFGIGVKHQVDQYFLIMPLNLAVQFMYNKTEITNLIKLNTWAFNVQASKKFGIVEAYGALQLESCKVDVNYTYKGDNGLLDKKISASVTGDDKFRFILGGALNLAFFTLNVDVNLASQTAITSGLTFSF